MNGMSVPSTDYSFGLNRLLPALGDWRYVTKDDIDSFGSIAKRQEVMSDEGWIGQEWQVLRCLSYFFFTVSSALTLQACKVCTVQGVGRATMRTDEA